MSNHRAAPPAPGPDEVTVMVFKDNAPSRSFQISLGWITRLGLAVGLLVSATLMGSFFAFKFYRVARQSDPSRLMDLESQISELKSDKKALEVELTALPPVAAVSSQRSVNPMPVPTVTVTVTPVAATAPAVNPVAPAPIAASTSAGALPLFSALPRPTRDLSADSAKLPITVSTAHTSWSGRTLKVEFDLNYVKPDHGSEQGRIIVLARGPNSLFAYPEGTLTAAGSESLISVPQGEYFSVSRFREVKAEFPDIRGTGPIHDIEVLIMNLEGQLIFYEKFAALEAPAAAKLPVNIAAPKPTDAVPAKPESSEFIEPGVDQ
jgi:hypothetical protein